MGNLPHNCGQSPTQASLKMIGGNPAVMTAAFLMAELMHLLNFNVAFADYSYPFARQPPPRKEGVL